MSEFQSHASIKKSSEKSFALVFATFFLIISLYPLIFGQNYRLWSLVGSGFFFTFGLLKPKIFTLPNTLWFKLGNLLGAIVAPLIISLVYVTTVVPIGLFFRLTKKDLINQKINLKKKSYWVKRTNPLSSMKNQF